MPDLLIGQDLVHLFNRRLQPTLPSGFYIVRTSMGPMIGGARRRVQPATKATTSSCPPATLAAVEDTDILDHLRCPATSLPSRTSATTGRLQLRPPDLSLDLPTYSVAGTTDTSRDDLTYSSAYSDGLLYSAAVSLLVNPPTYSVGDTTVTGTKELLEPSSSLQIASERPSSSRVPGVLPQSTQKQLSPKPLDTQLLLLPIHSSTNGDVEVVPAAYFALTPPRLSQDSLSSTEADLRYSIPPTPPHGDPIGAVAATYDAASTFKRKTRLRLRLPVHARQLLGIYTAAEPVTAVAILLSDATLVSLRAERHFQLALMPHSSWQTTIVLPVSPDQCPYALLLSAVLFLDASAAVSNGFSILKRPPPAANEHLRMFGRPGSRHEFLRRLRSSRVLPTRARTTYQCLTSATHKLSFHKSWLPGCTQPTMARRKRKPTSCT